MASHLPTQTSPRQGAAAPRTPKEVVSHGGKPHSKQSGHLANDRGGTGFVSKPVRKSEAKNQTDFVLQLLDEKPIVVNRELSEVLAELKRQGNNLNQIAKQLNQGTPFGEASKRVMNECWVTYRKILEMK